MSVVRLFKNLPERQQRRLLRCWTIAIVSTVMFFVFAYAAIFARWGWNGGVAIGVSVSCCTAFFSIPIAIRRGQNIRIDLMLKWEGPDTYSGTVSKFRRDKAKGRAIARNYQTLVTLAKTHDIRPLVDFGQADVYDRNIEYFTPQAAIEAVSKLAALVQERPAGINDPDAVTAELNDIRQILEESISRGRKFCFCIIDGL